ncbi:MAG: Asp23/Gls24 family envelope stress response protein [Microbacteriaceae bacterium]
MTTAPVSPTTTAASDGKTVIVDGVIAKVAALAVLEVPGVYALGGTMERMVGAVRGAFGDTEHGQGVSVEVGETQVAADVSLVADYPVPLQKVADDVRAAVYKVIQELVGMQVTEVNVTITDVHTGADDADADADKASRVQ